MMHHRPAPAMRIAIIGGGWAGLSCALTLAQSGQHPVVYEAAPEPGGRARAAVISGHVRDNGQHLMLTGCTALSRLFHTLGLDLPTADFAFQSKNRHLQVPAQAGKLGLLLALCRAPGFSFRERYALCWALLSLNFKGWQTPLSLTVAEWLSQTQQPASLIADFWEPLALAILNTPLHQAAMYRFSQVLRDTLGRGGEALRLLCPTGNLSDTVIQPWVRAIEAAGGAIHCGCRITGIQRTPRGYNLSGRIPDATHAFDQVVLAVPPWSLSTLALPENVAWPPAIRAFSPQPIATVYLGFDQDFRLPCPLLQIAGPRPTDARIWVTDRTHCGEPGVMAASLSADGPWHTLTPAALAEACLVALAKAIPQLPPCLWHKAVIVQRATHAATPATALTAQDLTPLPGLHLTGDWTHPSYPATLEAAVYAGQRSAQCILQSHAFSLE